MTDDPDIDGLAAEYVLGSLDISERKSVDERRKRDPVLDKAIADWEKRLGTLGDRLPGIAPSPDLYGKILARIASEPADTVVPIRNIRRRIGLATIGALAACLLLAIGWIIVGHLSGPRILVAQLHRVSAEGTSDAPLSPAFAVTIDAKARTLAVQPITVRPVTGRRYALWLMRREGEAPIFLGEVSTSQSTALPWPTDRFLAEFVGARLGVSLESEAGPLPVTPTLPMAFAGSLVASDGGKR